MVDYDPTMDPRSRTLEDCAGECDAQAEALLEEIRRGDMEGEVEEKLARMRGQLDAYRGMAEHFRAQQSGAYRVAWLLGRLRRVRNLLIAENAQATLEIVEEIDAWLGADQVRVAEEERDDFLRPRARRGAPTVAEAEREFLRLRPVPDEEVAGRRVEDVCDAHGWATEGMPRRLVDAMRARRGRGGLTVCRDCVDRARAEADRERQQVTP